MVKDSVMTAGYPLIKICTLINYHLFAILVSAMFLLD